MTTPVLLHPERQFAVSTYTVWLGDSGSTIPADLTDPTDPFFAVGYTTPDSLKFTDTPDFTAINSAQSQYATRQIQKPGTSTIEVDMQEWSGKNLKAAFGGGTITQIQAADPGPPPVPAIYKFDPPAIGGRKELTCLIDMSDGARNYRFVVPRVMQTSGVELGLPVGDESVLPLQLAVLGSTGVQPWYLISDDPAMDDGTGA